MPNDKIYDNRTMSQKLVLSNIIDIDGAALALSARVTLLTVRLSFLAGVELFLLFRQFFCIFLVAGMAHLTLKI